MLLNCSDSEKLFAKSVPVSIKDVYTNQSRKSQLFLTMEWQDASAGMYSRKVLGITLTEESDPFFLYNLHLSEEDFDMLKNSQGLLINFASFPQHIIDYAEMCLLEERNPQPKFMLTFTINEKLGNAASLSHLDIIETNQFKHLTHLSLKFVAATDSAVRQYLASCFRNLKEERRQLQNRLSFLDQDLKDKLASCQHTLNSKAQELEELKRESRIQMTMKDSEHNQELQEERNRLLNRLKEEENRIENERREKEDSFRKQIQQLEARISCFDSLNKELQDKNYKHEATIKELKSNLLSSDEKIRRLKENLHSYKQKYESLHSELREKQSHVRHQDDKISELEQELQDRNHSVTRLKEQMDRHLKQKESDDVELENVRLQFEMSEKSREILEEDKSKLNEVILKLQHKIKTGAEKVKAESELNLKKEQEIKEKDKLLHQLEKKTCKLNSSLEAKIAEVKTLTVTLNSLEKNAKALEDEVKTKQDVIKWLNQQLTNRGIIPQYTPPSNLGPSPSSLAQQQLENIRSRNLTSPECSPTTFPVTNRSAVKSVRTVTPSDRKGNFTPSRYQQTDSAYYTSPSDRADQATLNNHLKSDLNFNPTDFEIDPAALSAAFGNKDPIPKHSTAKKQSNTVKSTISKLPKRR